MMELILRIEDDSVREELLDETFAHEWTYAESMVRVETVTTFSLLKCGGIKIGTHQYGKVSYPGSPTKKTEPSVEVISGTEYTHEE